jgi:hypothetical protein
MKRLDQLSKSILNTHKEAALNTRNIQTNFPLVERKLDILASDQGYSMDFPLTKNNHSVLLTLHIKPDNCCECEPGAATVIRDGEAYYQDGKIGPSYAYEYNIAYPAVYLSNINQTGSIFNTGWSLPIFTYPMYQAFDSFANYSIDSNGRILIPVDGVYSILFQCTINGTIESGAASLIQMIKVDHLDENGDPILDINGDPFIEILSKKIYSVTKLNLATAGGPPNSLSPDHIILYATCVNLNKGDTVGGWLEVNDISSFHASGGWLGDGGGLGDEANNTHLTLLGLGYGILLGYVYDISDHSPIQGATVSYTNLFGDSTTTDEFGGYAFYDLTPGTYSMTATMAGYITQTQSVTVLFNKIAYIDFNLTHL